MIQFANKAMVSELKKIWKECFHDEDSYINFFFCEYFNDKTTLVYMEDEKPVSMLTLMPAKLHERTGIREVYYVYAVATLPEAQGRGYSSKLLYYANEITKNATFLQPATKELESFYEKKGYLPTIARKSCVVTEKQLEELEHDRLELEDISDSELKVASLLREDRKPAIHELMIRELTKEDSGLYKKIRDYKLSSVGYIEWEESVLAYAIKENALTGGKTLLIDDRYVAMVREYEGILYIREHTMPSDMVLKLAKQLLAKSSASECSIHLIRTDSLQVKDEQIVMSCFEVEKGNGYFNLAFE
ncbi:GNAT family N-acetyltransferase [Anaerosporobacter sp.]|uniref:GNAT family N-acetyltransferase n=1 Tax=Anaerosporobacter sp. TaxID=1872529 RepID=UPI00286F6932|nr:GNAT family N-acetyltransferase [Anaerosporobacter sp.]